ncbi:MAG: hypothetical protein ACTHNQ_18780 [Microbacterium sp.]|uniref:hypothetical protein n=1 Tax=Microbacterium sp. TaxID=51671 RepID=UPI003F7F1D7E
MPAPTDPAADELRALRARAYGPDADIHADPAALARLQELEAQNRSAATPAAEERTPLPLSEEAGTDAAGPTTAPVDDVATDDPAPAPAAADGDAPGAATAPEDGIPSADAATEHPAATPPWWRRRRARWAGSLVVALVLGVVLTLSVQAITSGRVATLGVDRNAEWPTDTFGARPPDALQFEEFHGLSVLSLGQAFGGGLDQVCISVQSTPNGSDGVGAWGCGTVDFPAAAAFTVPGNSPQELRDVFPVGTSLKFVLDGDQVHVYAKEPSPIGGS